MSKIEWTEETWNPTTGCTKVSAGCKHCYAEVMARRLQAMGVRGYENGFRVTIHPDRLEKPRSHKTPTVFFVNSMSDLFHKAIPYSFTDRVFSVIEDTPHHTYQILTKRPEIMADYCHSRYSSRLPGNVLLGVSVENRQSLPRVDILRTIPSRKFLSVEPLLEDLGKIDFTGIDWVIVGGESGAGARPMRKEWVESIREHCQVKGIPFFFKQWGAFGEDGVKRSKKANGRVLGEKVYAGMPGVGDS